MRTRHKAFLEKKKRSKFREKEVQILLGAAGHDRPKLEDLQKLPQFDSPSGHTRQKSKNSQKPPPTPATPRQIVQVVIQQPPKSARNNNFTPINDTSTPFRNKPVTLLTPPSSAAVSQDTEAKYLRSGRTLDSRLQTPTNRIIKARSTRETKHIALRGEKSRTSELPGKKVKSAPPQKQPRSKIRAQVANSRNHSTQRHLQAIQAFKLKRTKMAKAMKMIIEKSNTNDGPVACHSEKDNGSQNFPLDENCTHYTYISDVPWDIQKYWHQRYSMFSYYDYGIYMTDDAWFGVTPEPVANEVASDYASFASPSKTTIIDIFAGAGGNSIAFALSNRWNRVIAIEKNPSVIACAQNNASIYGVANQITWINDDSFDYLSSHKNLINPKETVIFASPPWGGPGYTSENIFDLSTMYPYSAQYIHESCKTMDVALYLPRTSDLRQIVKLAPEGKKVEVVQYCMQGASKALVAYIPANES